LRDGLQQAERNRAGRLSAKDAGEEEDRNHRQILQQEHRQARPAGVRREAVLPRQKVDDDGGRGERKTGPDQGCRRRRVVKIERGDQTDGGPRHRDLQAA
jgi:hypothetical protein